jgi:3-deoxy-D-manno-octulosonic-acid transferase
MNLLDFGYLAAAALVGAGARCCLSALPEGWQVRLTAEAPDLPSHRWVWVHAVSVGELMLAEGLLGRMIGVGKRVHVTTGTPAGLSLLAQKLPQWDAGSGLVSGGAFPLDDPEGLRPFLRRPPGAFVALETELWPGLMQALERLQIPRLIVNGRLTERSLQRGGRLLRRAASRLTLVAARDEASAAAFRHLGASLVELGGNLKADLPAPRPLSSAWNGLRTAWAHHPILVAGNTVAGEEALILAAWHSARTASPGLRLILAPRQPRRFEAVATLLGEAGIPFSRASQPWPEADRWESLQVLLLDTLGDLAAAYAEGSVALVGGGWLHEGGHNPLESVRAGVPTLLGPGFTNFEDLVPPLEAAGLIQVVPSEELNRVLEATILKTPLRPAGSPALPPALVGALDRSWRLISPYLP